jgi:PAT family beta-lactamase induction signal transducer AmpG
MLLSLMVLAIPLIAVAILGLTFLSDPGEDALERGLWITAVVSVAVVSATYDIASDAYRADVLSKEELGAGASSFVSAYRLALVVAGAGVLALSAKIGWAGAWIAGAALIAVGVAGTMIAKEPPQVVQPRQSAFVAPLENFWKAWGARLLVLALFVSLFRLPDQVGNSYSLPFLLKHMQFEANALGYLRQALGLAFTVVGAVLGGWLVARLGLMRCLWIFGVLQAATNGGYMALSIAQDAGQLEMLPDVFGGGPVRVAWLSAVLIVENLAGGMVAAGFVAFLMSLCDHRYTAAQYSILSALMALGGSMGIQLSASLPDQIGWTWFFAFTMALGIPGLLLIRFVGAPPPLASSEPCPKR